MGGGEGSNWFEQAGVKSKRGHQAPQTQHGLRRIPHPPFPTSISFKNPDSLVLLVPLPPGQRMITVTTVAMIPALPWRKLP